jgi:hypothetical protein
MLQPSDQISRCLWKSWTQLRGAHEKLWFNLISSSLILRILTLGVHDMSFE